MTKNSIFSKAVGFDDPAALPLSISGLSQPALDWNDYGNNNESAVIMLLIPSTNLDSPPANLVLTRRTTTVGTHKGQIGFAGGRANPSNPRDGASSGKSESGDGTPIVTALRELYEELSIPSEKVVIHGILPAITSIYRTPVYPVVGTSNIKPEEITISEDEVDEVILEPWTSFTPQKNQPFDFTIFGKRRNSNLFDLPSNPVWGLTAKIIADANLK